MSDSNLASTALWYFNIDYNACNISKILKVFKFLS